MKMIKVLFVILIALLLLSACSNGVTNYDGSIRKSDRFVGDADNLRIIKDSETGCEYISQRFDTGWTYVHGSCPDIIAEEYSLKNLEK